MLKMTLWGVNQYLDGTLLDFLPEVLPEDRYDPEILEQLLYIECGDLYPYYQVPDYLKLQIKNFFIRNKEQFTRAWDALYSEYNPIENYDRKEAWSDSHSFSESLSSSESVHASTSTSDSTSSSSEGKVSAYNSPTQQPQSASNGQAATTSKNANDTNGFSHSIRNNKGLDDHRGRVHGNIGVTTTQQMIQASLDLANYDIYLWVVTVFQKNIISAIV